MKLAKSELQGKYSKFTNHCLVDINSNPYRREECDEVTWLVCNPIAPNSLEIHPMRNIISKTI